MSKLAICTPGSNNDLAYARLLAESCQRHKPDAEFHVCIVDRPHPSVDHDSLPFRLVFAGQLDVPGFSNPAFRLSILGLNNTVKPFLPTHLRKGHGADRAIYLDPDILKLDTLQGVRHAVDHHPIALPTHITRPLSATEEPPERFLLQAGVYDLGFLALRLDGSTAEFLSWWQDRLPLYGINDPASGLFIDRCWMDLAPAFLDAAAPRDPGYRIAYLNQGYRSPECVEGRPLRWFKAFEESRRHPELSTDAKGIP